MQRWCIVEAVEKMEPTARREMVAEAAEASEAEVTMAMQLSCPKQRRHPTDGIPHPCWKRLRWRSRPHVGRITVETGIYG